ncbi:hypothetical protein L0Y49_01605 [bacterium]|nr:hypothetical protein [bacterium]MCI0565816.1 hypothetical protein [bacterium]MCI0680103.1 hypothetical protein [bacterium]
MVAPLAKAIISKTGRSLEKDGGKEERETPWIAIIIMLLLAFIIDVLNFIAAGLIVLLPPLGVAFYIATIAVAIFIFVAARLILFVIKKGSFADVILVIFTGVLEATPGGILPIWTSSVIVGDIFPKMFSEAKSVFKA